MGKVLSSRNTRCVLGSMHVVSISKVPRVAGESTVSTSDPNASVPAPARVRNPLPVEQKASGEDATGLACCCWHSDSGKPPGQEPSE